MQKANISVVGEDLLRISHDTAQVIAQQCNCTSTYAKGLSKSVISQYPYADFYSNRNLHLSKPGHIEIKGDGNNMTSRFVLAMYAQLYPGSANASDDTIELRQAWFKQCLNQISLTTGLKSIAFPYNIGCGLAGGHWPSYEKMIYDFADNNPHLQIYICKIK
jgi:hypothetical protein